MAFDDGPTDGETNAHARLFGRVERFKKAPGVQRSQTDPRISDGQENALACREPGLDTELLGTLLHVFHGVDAISQQVENHLLQLDAISHDDTRGRAQTGLQSYALSLGLFGEQAEHLL